MGKEPLRKAAWHRAAVPPHRRAHFLGSRARATLYVPQDELVLNDGPGLVQPHQAQAVGHERVGDEHVGERDVHGHHDRHLQ